MSFPISIIPSKLNVDFVGKKHYAFIFSILLSACVIFLLFFNSLNLGIDFTGGMIFDIRSDKKIDIDSLRKTLTLNKYENSTIQESGNQSVIIRLRIDKNRRLEDVTSFKDLITQNIENAEFNKIDYVGPKVGEALVHKATLAVLFSLLGIMIYIALRFDLRFAVGITVALFHDALATLGFYMVTRYEFDLTSIAAILTVVGYSVNDSVVIYDRIRENLNKHNGKTLIEVINRSINETLSRTIMTVLTTLLVCLALILLGGYHLRGFSMAMFFGIAFGTYSSIYISAPILIMINNFYGLKNTEKV
ncbi:protein translocase subunit SecF [Candidatus Lariskella endosymbiont of Hedychridium roseum]|uniref:protein translocase subunit SecF n=1 Tax=Candidatus Lariskella endosymbiont of Hedychridium roseum TaxID=3077949 RepID=UPI0030D0A918